MSGESLEVFAVVSVCCAGDKVAVGYQSGAVLTLHAAWLIP
jgi:hypothetical protein